MMPACREAVMVAVRPGTILHGCKTDPLQDQTMHLPSSRSPADSLQSVSKELHNVLCLPPEAAKGVVRQLIV